MHKKYMVHSVAIGKDTFVVTLNPNVSTMSEREGRDNIELLAGANLHTIRSLQSHPIPSGFFDLSGSDFLVGGIRIVIDPDSNLQKVYVPQWNVKNGFCLDDGGVCREMLEAPEKSLRDEVTTLNERNTILEKENNALDVKVTDLQAVVVSKDRELTNSAANLLL
nr:hypothetical protein [Tanacetum cinerariifolium]